jgi:hypothetical protein
MQPQSERLPRPRTEPGADADSQGDLAERIAAEIGDMGPQPDAGRDLDEQGEADYHHQDDAEAPAEADFDARLAGDPGWQPVQDDECNPLATGDAEAQEQVGAATIAPRSKLDHALAKRADLRKWIAVHQEVRESGITRYVLESRLLDHAFSDRRLRKEAVAVLKRVFDPINKYNMLSWPSSEKIAKQLDMQETHVNRALRLLVTHGYVVRTDPHKKRPRWATNPKTGVAGLFMSNKRDRGPVYTFGKTGFETYAAMVAAGRGNGTDDGAEGAADETKDGLIKGGADEGLIRPTLVSSETLIRPTLVSSNPRDETKVGLTREYRGPEPDQPESVGEERAGTRARALARATPRSGVLTPAQGQDGELAPLARAARVPKEQRQGREDDSREETPNRAPADLRRLALADKVLLGWTADAPKSDELIDFGSEPSTETLDLVVTLADDKQLEAALVTATRNRIGKALRSSAGLYAYRSMIATIVDHIYGPHDADPVFKPVLLNDLDRVSKALLQAVRERIGATNDTLNSWELIGKRVRNKGDWSSGRAPAFYAAAQPSPQLAAQRCVPPAQAPLDPLLAELIEADGAQVLTLLLKANRQVWAKRLHKFLAEQRAKHGCTDADIMAVAVDQLRRLTVAEGAELAAALLSERGQGGHVKRWNMFFASVASAMERNVGNKTGAG